MKTKIWGPISIAVGIALVFGLVSSINSPQKNHESLFHITLADPNLYKDDIYSESFDVPKGEYQFHFVANGDSPKILKIRISGSSLSFDEDFVLEGDLESTGISEYYTWDYFGSAQFSNPIDQSVQIIIDPNGNVKGPVSVDINLR